MATLTIRNLDDGLKARLRGVAARHGRSMEEEVRQILRERLTADTRAEGATQHRHLASVDGNDPEASMPNDQRAEANLRQRREEAARWYEAYRRQVVAERNQEAASLTDEDVNALVHELR